MKKTVYITSAIPYVNAQPHIGHAQEFIYADVLKRHAVLSGKEVLYLSGADENALKILQAAEKAGKTPQEFTDEHNEEFLQVARKLDVHFDIWQRGTDREHHFPSSQKLWELCAKSGDIYKKTYTGLYCVGCEMFYTLDELNENGECIEHPGKKLDQVSEENYFFKLSKYQSFLEILIETDGLHITPEIRKNEALAFIKKGLEDFSISRSIERARNWGIPVPGDPNQIMYVWFDALNIYQTGVGFGWNEQEYHKWAPQDIMVIGKGITRFHAVYWPAILKSAGLSLPKELFIHGYLTVGGQKMSKTLGNVVDPIEVINTYGTDAVRYYLLREIPLGSDGDFSASRMQQLYNADLANELGNLISRVTTLAATDGIVISKSITQRSDEISNLIKTYDFSNALQLIWNRIRQLNKELNDVKPWELTADQRKTHLENWLLKLHVIGSDLAPFMPHTSQCIMKSVTGPISKITPLFPRLKLT